MQIPTHDLQQNLLHDLTPVSWQWIESKIPHLVHSIHAEGPHPGHRGAHRHLHVMALDTPETDSHIKQLASHVGELVNHPHILVTKEGQQGMQAWRISNRMHDGGPARPEATWFATDHSAVTPHPD